MVAIRGHFDGSVFVPDEPSDAAQLPRNQALILHVEVANEPAAPQPGQDLWGVLARHAGSVEAPSDWSAAHDHYLYGTPKERGKADG